MRFFFNDLFLEHMVTLDMIFFSCIQSNTAFQLIKTFYLAQVVIA